MQKWVIYIIMGKTIRYSIEPLFGESNLCSIKQLYIVEILKFMFKKRKYYQKISINIPTRAAGEDKSIIQKLTTHLFSRI